MIVQNAFVTGVVGIVPANSRHTARALTNGRLIIVDTPFDRTSGLVDQGYRYSNSACFQQRPARISAGHADKL